VLDSPVFLAEPVSVAFSPDGTTLVIADREGEAVHVVKLNLHLVHGSTSSHKEEGAGSGSTGPGSGSGVEGSLLRKEEIRAGPAHSPTLHTTIKHHQWDEDLAFRQAAPCGVAVDASNTLWCADQYNVKGFDMDGTLLHEQFGGIDLQGSGVGLAADPCSKNIAVTRFSKVHLCLVTARPVKSANKKMSSRPRAAPATDE
jgi:hypothetical protein